MASNFIPLTFSHTWRLGNLKTYIKCVEENSYVQSPCYGTASQGDEGTGEVRLTYRMLFYPKGTSDTPGHPMIFLKLVTRPNELRGGITMKLMKQSVDESIVVNETTIEAFQWHASSKTVHVCTLKSDLLEKWAGEDNNLTLECSGTAVVPLPSNVAPEVKEQLQAPIASATFPPDLELMLKLDKFTDVILSTPYSHFRAHKLVLSAWSTFFADMFCNAANSACQVFLHNLFDWQVNALLSFMYKGSVDNLGSIARDLHPVASRFQIKSLQDQCEKHIINDLPKYEHTDFVGVIAQAFRYGSPEFQKTAITFLLQSSLTNFSSREDWVKLSRTDPPLVLQIINAIEITMGSM